MASHFKKRIYKSDRISVDASCSRTFPCEHHVSINNETRLMTAPEIYKLIREETNHVPNHFDHFVDR